MPDDRPHRIVILVDASGTMATKRREVLAPASDLAETTLPNTRMALLIFKDKVEEQVSFSQGQSVVAERLRQIRSMKNASGQAAGGRTALFDSLLAGLQLLETPTSADTLYVISDGADNASHAHFNDVAQRLSSSGVRMFVSLTVGHFGNRSPTPEEERGPCVEVGWRLSASHWGKGLATEGAREVIRYAFEVLRLDDVVSFTVPANARSRRVMEKLSMTHDPADDFDHPKLPESHPLRRHVLYRLNASAHGSP